MIDTDDNTAPEQEVGAGDDAVESALAGMVPQMREDARIHRTWTTEEARRDVNHRYGDRSLGEWVGDVAWHQQWAEYYDRVADTMERACVEIQSLRAELEAAKALNAQLQSHLDDIETTCLRVCPDNSPDVVDEPNTELGRFVCQSEDGEPIIDADTAVGVIEGMNRCWVALGERAEMERQRVAELTASSAAAEARVEQLVNALRGLTREVRACWGMESDARSAFGNTNYQIVADWIDAARTALSTGVRSDD